MIKAECLVWATIVQLFSFIRIDVIHHQVHILLCEVVKTAITSINIREYSSYQFVVNLYTAVSTRRPVSVRMAALCALSIRSPSSRSSACLFGK